MQGARNQRCKNVRGGSLLIAAAIARCGLQIEVDVRSADFAISLKMIRTTSVRAGWKCVMSGEQTFFLLFELVQRGLSQRRNASPKQVLLTIR